MKLVDLNPIIDFSFWQKLYYLKLDELKLSEDPVPVIGRCKCSKFESDTIRLNLDAYSFDVSSPFKIKPDTYHTVNLTGYVKIINKKTEFENICTHTDVLIDEIDRIHNDNQFDFLIVLHIDHKKFDFVYSFFQTKWVRSLTSIVGKITVVEKYEFKLNIKDIEQSNGILLNKNDGVLCDTLPNINVGKIALNFVIKEKLNEKNNIYLIKDPLIISENTLEKNLTVKAIRLELKNSNEMNDSPLLVRVFKEKSINMKSFLSKEQMIEDQSSLNLKLMKWRLEPRLDLQQLSNTKILMLGTGTLGCNLARLLIAYGIKNITFLDNGYVNYSNLARQSLFNIESFDEQDKGIPKVEAAKMNLLKVSPDANIETAHLNVPMPGHYIKTEQLNNSLEDLNKLEILVKTHDVIFNVFDSREARYFPTILSALYGKLCISVGIGYESFVIVKHGNYKSGFYEKVLEEVAKTHNEKIPEEKLENNIENNTENELEWKPELLSDNGCFFCSDYLPPTDSMSNRSLDQQCTVSRPGISMVSCGVAVELLINSLHEGKVGKIPHFIRGLVGGGFELADYENSKYDNCVACSHFVIKEYVKDRKDFLFNVLNNPDILNTITKFNDQVDMMEEADFEEIIEFGSSWQSSNKDE